jgi:hypothetical protein
MWLSPHFAQPAWAKTDGKRLIDRQGNILRWIGGCEKLTLLIAHRQEYWGINLPLLAQY